MRVHWSHNFGDYYFLPDWKSTVTLAVPFAVGSRNIVQNGRAVTSTFELRIA